MQKITPHLWFDKQAKEAAEFYVSLIPGSKIKTITTLHNTPSGDADIVSFELAGQPFMAISAGPLFKFNPTVSFHLKCESKEQVDAVWAKLEEGGGTVRMPLGAYPFSERYGWREDKYGLNWQVIYVGGVRGGTPIAQRITPVLMFTEGQSGRAEEAINFYADVFKNAPAHPAATAQVFARYEDGEAPDVPGTVKYAAFTLDGLEFGAMDSARTHGFAFNEAVSFIVPCESQEEIDYFWEKLSADPKAEQCGWLKDRFGLSWQITATRMNEMMGSGDQEKIARVTQAFLKMKKFDIEALEKAFQG